MIKKKYIRPKNMPKDYLKQITSTLENEGIDVNYDKVRAILRGKTIDVELTICIKRIIRELAKKHREHTRRLKSIQHSLRKG